MTTLPHATSPVPRREPVDLHDWRLTRPRTAALAIVFVAMAVIHGLLYLFLPAELFPTSGHFDGPLTLGLFVAHFFAAGCAALRWCDGFYTTRWSRTHTFVLAFLAVASMGILALTWSSTRADGFSELWLLPVVLFVWWWQGLRTATGFAAGYATIVIMWWALIRAGGGVNEINLLPMLVFVLFYGALYGRPWLLGYLYIYLFAVRFIPDYLLATTLVAALLYTTLPTFARSFRDTTNRLVPISYMVGLFLLATVLMPVVYLATDSSLQDLSKTAGQPDVKAALVMSLITSGIAMTVVTLLGVPLAYALSRADFPGKSLVLTAADLPIVIPPPVAGIALLIYLGPRTPLGSSLEEGFRGVVTPDSPLGQWMGGQFAFNSILIILAQIFVSSPFLIRACLVAFQGVDSHYERVARTLGSTSVGAFWRVTLPLAARGIVAGMVLCWLRALAEFGSLNILAYYPRTAPILAMEKFQERGDLSEAQPIAVLILVMSLAVFLAMWLVRAAPSRIKALATG